VTIAIITVGVIGIAGAVGATERLAGINQDQSQLEVAMRHLADFVRDSSTKGLAYQPCEQSTANDNSYYNTHLPAVQVPVASWTITNVNESPYPGGGTRNGVGGTSDPPLPPTPQFPNGGFCSATRGDWGVQEITLKVSDAQRSVTRNIWKSNSW
jgi:hypothetical protein